MLNTSDREVPPPADATDETSFEFDPEYGADQLIELSLDAGEMHYLEKGDGEPIVFLGPVPYWQAQVEAISTRYHASAFMFADFAMVRTPEGLALALEALDLGPVHFVAHSAGTFPTVALAAERPDLIRSLVLVDPAVFDLSGATPETCSLTDISAAELAACRFSSQVNGPGWFESWPREIRQIVSDGLADANASPPDDPPDFESQDMAFPSLCDDELPLAMTQNDIPILFVRGNQTPAYFQAGHDEYEACLPIQESVTVEGAAHWVHLDRPAEVNRVILDFVDRL
jgi:pimeloyl-ACP methyl ester carboxylesterase